jgi:hypothetical protein
MNALPMPSASVAAVVNPANLPVYDGPTGSVEGTVLVRGPESPNVPVDPRGCPAAMDTYGKLFRAGPARPDGLRPLADAVVVVTGYAGAYIPEPEEAQRVTISPSRCGYPLRTIAMTFGQRLEISNDSKLSFAPYLEGTFQPAVMIAPPERNGEPVKLYPPQTGWFGLRDRMQPFVRNDVFVLRNPLHAVSDLAGHFRVDGVPVGKLKVGARLPPVGSEAEVDVEVRPNVVESVEVVLTYTPQDLVKADAGIKRWPVDGGPRLNPND